MTHTYTTKAALLGLMAAGAFLALIALPASSRAMESTTASTTGQLHNHQNVDATCMQTAVDAREDALAAAWTAYNSSMTSALSARKAALHSAWGLSDAKARGTAIMKAWKDWRNASKVAHAKLRTDRKAAWTTFKTTAKNSCKANTPKDENLGADTAGTISL